MIGSEYDLGTQHKEAWMQSENEESWSSFYTFREVDVDLISGLLPTIHHDCKLLISEKQMMYQF